MTRIQTTLEQLKKANKKALIPYITAGDPNPSLTLQLMHTLVKAGANMIELGVPFSDPAAEGPVIEAAHHRALKHQVTLEKVLGIVKEFRQQDSQTPIVLMGYLNPFEKMGYHKFAQAASKAEVDAVLIVDLPPEEANEWLPEMRANNIDTIFLITPTTSPERMKIISETGSGYLYYVSVKGVTGSNALNISDVEKNISAIKIISSLPVAVGFGIHNAESAAAIAKISDGVIVGTALIKRLTDCEQNEKTICNEAFDFIQELRNAMDNT